MDEQKKKNVMLRKNSRLLRKTMADVKGQGVPFTGHRYAVRATLDILSALIMGSEDDRQLFGYHPLDYNFQSLEQVRKVAFYSNKFPLSRAYKII